MTSRPAVRFARLLRAFALALALLPAAPLAAAPERIALHNGRIFLPVGVGTRRVDALLDSGAEMTVVDTALAAELGLADNGAAETLKGSGGKAQVRFAEGVTLTVAGVTLQDLTVAILDLSDISARLNAGEPIRMILGREFFDAGRWALDLREGEIEARDRAALPPGEKLPLTTRHGIEMMPVSVEGQAPVLAAFDLGNGRRVLIGADYARRGGFLADGRKLEPTTNGGIGGAHETVALTLGRIDLAGKRFTDVPAVVDDLENADDLNIGSAILRNYRITVDFAEHALWLDPLPPGE